MQVTTYINHKLTVGMRVMVFNATFNQYFIYIVAVSFICGGNWSSWRKPL